MIHLARRLSILFVICFSIVSSPAFSDGIQAQALVCRLDPQCGKPKSRSFHVGERGVKVEGEIKEAPPSVNLYVNFAFDSAVLTQDGKITLDQLGQALKDPRLTAFSFKIAGHTDAIGSDAYNLLLSERRANSVRVYLSQKFQISSDRLIAVGYGRTQLLDPSKPQDGINRRVQVINVGEMAAH